MKIEDLKQTIQNYINTPDTDYAIMINGVWGVGKTYFVYRNYLYNEESGNNYLYISLNGVQNLDEIKSRFISNLIDSTSDDNLEKILNNVNLNLGIVNNLNVGKLFTFFKEKHYNKKETNSIINNKIIVLLDDLERININIKECFGYISTYFLEKGIKVIIISNENEIKDENNFKDYNKVKEKVIQYTYTIDDFVDIEVIKSISASFNSKIMDDFINENVIEIFNECKIKNLRLIKFVLERFNSFLTIHHSLNIEIEHKLVIFKNILLFSNEYKKENNFKDIFKPFSNNLINANNLNFNFKMNEGTLKDYTYILNKEFYLFPSIYKFVFENYVTVNFNNEYNTYKDIFDNEYTKALSSLYNYGFIDNIVEVIETVKEGVSNNKYTLNNLYEINKIIHYISNNYDNIVEYNNFQELILKSIEHLESTDNLPNEPLYFFKDDVPNDNKVKIKIFEINSRLEEINFKKEITKKYEIFKTDSNINFSEIINKIGVTRNIFEYINFLDFGNDLLKIKPAERSYYSILSFIKWLKNLLKFDEIDDMIFDIYEKLFYIIERISPQSIKDESERIRATNFKNDLNEFLNEVENKLKNNENYKIEINGRLLKN